MIHDDLQTSLATQSAVLSLPSSRWLSVPHWLTHSLALRAAQKISYKQMVSKSRWASLSSTESMKVCFFSEFVIILLYYCVHKIKVGV